jgi:hypothetical protein
MQGPSQPTANRKRLDPRIQSLIKNCVKTNHRSFFIVLGDKAVDQVVNLHFLLSQSRHTARPNVLWCYKKELGFTSNRKKREQKIKREVKKGHREVGDMDPFELFVSLTDIRYTYVAACLWFLFIINSFPFNLINYTFFLSFWSDITKRLKKSSAKLLACSFFKISRH